MAHDSTSGREVVMASTWRLTESAMEVGLATRDVVDSNEISG
jgi:hypothetical protein